ncbi:MAG TPA: hypothetical protein VE591_12395 [Candidatus Acidoferrum sp.]|nr:hypothetical protein [Candidatus Acidoferrum sp.]
MADDKYIAVVFPDAGRASDGLHALWNLDDTGDITVHGAVLVTRDKLGEIVVEQKDTFPPWRTAAGLGLGALIGALAGPAGAAIGAAKGAGIGAAAGGLAGLTGDVAKADTNDQALVDAGVVLPIGQHALIGEITESWDVPLDSRMSELGGKVYRRAKSDVRNDKWDDYDSVLYPYDYEPRIVTAT